MDSHDIQLNLLNEQIRNFEDDKLKVDPHEVTEIYNKAL